MDIESWKLASLFHIHYSGCDRFILFFIRSKNSVVVEFILYVSFPMSSSCIHEKKNVQRIFQLRKLVNSELSLNLFPFSALNTIICVYKSLEEAAFSSNPWCIQSVLHVEWVWEAEVIVYSIHKMYFFSLPISCGGSLPYHTHIQIISSSTWTCRCILYSPGMMGILRALIL